MKREITWYEFSGKIQIEIMGYVDLRDRHPARKGIPCWIFVAVEKGQRTLLADHKELRINKREFFLLPPYTKQEPLEEEEHSAYYVHFYADGKAVNEPGQVDASKVILPSQGILPTEPDCFSTLRYLCDHILSPYANQDFLKMHFQAMLSLISLQCQKFPYYLQKKISVNERCLGFIREHACEPLRAKDYEEVLGLGYHQINQKFKEQFGCTVKQYHQHIRMKYAAQILQAGVNVEQAARQCGYEDYFFFIRSFTKEYGISPGHYRRMHGVSADS